MPTTTTNYSFNKPTVGGDEDAWGGYLNGNWDTLDTLLGGVTNAELSILDGATVTTAELNTLDGITATVTELNYNDITTLGTVEASKVVTADANGDVTFPDGEKIVLGTGGDLELYHDGTNSYIKEAAGVGSLRLEANNILAYSNEGDAYFQCVSNGAFRAYYDGSTKITTASTGVDVTGELIADSYNETYAAVTSSSNATTVDCEAGNAFSHTLTENTTFTFSNPPASGTAYSFSLEIIQDSSASGYSVTWPSSVDWPSATAPTLTATASAKDVFVFYTRDGGTTFYGFTAGQALG
jgi:hypothetical protein